MSGRSGLTQSAQLREIQVFLMGATGEGVTGVDPADTGFVARFRRQGATADTTLALTAVAADAAIAANQWRDYGDGAYTVVASSALYASGARFAKLFVDCTTPETLADVVWVNLSADDFIAAAETSAGNSLTFLADLADSDGAAARAAIATAVMADLADSDGAAARAAITAAVLAAVDGRAIGVTSQPVGGSTVVLPITPVGGGSPTQRKRMFLASNGDFAGLTAIEAIP